MHVFPYLPGMLRTPSPWLRRSLVGLCLGCDRLRWSWQCLGVQERNERIPLRTAYNYTVADKDPGGYIHNGAYIQQLLFDSTCVMGGAPSLDTVPDRPASCPPRNEHDD